MCLQVFPTKLERTMSSAPSIMVSSTFYDLRQIRVDLTHFIMEGLGYKPLVSELPSFPIDPDLNTIENCRARVEKNADIMVLVVGGRYGSIDNETEKSITNLEFLTARAKGIPIYVFIEKRILSLLPTWKKNPSGDFSDTVDTPKLFEFVEYVRNQERVWTFPFETAQEIINALRIQLSYLFYDSLLVRLRLSGTELPSYFEPLRTKSLKIVLEKPRCWEYRLFLQSWIDEVELRRDLIRAYQARLTLEPAEPVAAQEASDWLMTRIHELKGLLDSTNHLINHSAQEAFGKPGELGNAEEIVWTSRMLGIVLENILKWAVRIRCARIEAPFDRLKPDVALFADDLITQLQVFPKDGLRKIEEALKIETPERPLELNMSMVLKLSNEEAFYKALSEVK